MLLLQFAPPLCWVMNVVAGPLTLITSVSVVIERAPVTSPETLNAMPPGRASVGVSRSQAAPNHAIAGKVRIATVLRSVCIGLLLEAPGAIQPTGTALRTKAKHVPSRRLNASRGRSLRDQRVWCGGKTSGAHTMVPPPERRRATDDGQDCRNCSAEMPNCLIFTCRVL